MRRLAVVFPGIGYHTDKPLLYFSKRMAQREFDCEIREVPYTGFSVKIKGNEEKMQAAFESALAQTRDLLADVDFSAYKQIVFLSKSIGTAVGAAYARERGVAAHHVYYTPVAQTFAAAQAESGIVFHGTADPWCADEPVVRFCQEKNLPLTIVEQGNHSLECGDVLQDLAQLQRVMVITREYLQTILV